MDGALGANLNLWMDKLAHRRPVAPAEGGQETAGELIARVSQLLAPQALDPLLRASAEARST
jgi:hypothetical protein